MKRKETKVEKGENDKTANGGRKGGRPEILTESLARKICRLIETFPDNEIEVNWNNVTTQVKHKFKHEIGRRALSQKSWGGRKLIAEAFDEAKDVQRRLGNDGGKRHATTSRQNLLRKVETLQARLQEAKQAVETMRANQYDALDRLRVTHFDLRKAVEDIRSNP
jgi:hypothetical protein